MSKVLNFRKRFIPVPERDPDAPRLPVDASNFTTEGFQLSDDMEGLPLPFDPFQKGYRLKKT